MIITFKAVGVGSENIFRGEVVFKYVKFGYALKYRQYHLIIKPEYHE